MYQRLTQHAKTGDEQLVSWKNGLGSTAQIAIRPQERDPTKQSYIWRLALSRVKDSCTHPMIPGYDESFLLLPGVDTKLTDASSMHLYHNSQAESIKLYPLVPYTFSGNWTTTCKLESGEQRYLSLSVNRKLANASMTIENIYALKNENDAVSNGAEEHVDAVTEDATGAGDAKIKHAATNKFLMGRFTTVHVISGTIQLTVQGQDEAHVLQKGETLTCERERNASPTELAMTPLPSAQAGLGIQDPIMQEEGHSDSGAIVLVIQIQVFDNERSDNATSPFLGPPAAPQRPRLPSGQKSFIDDAAGIHDPNSKHWESAHIYRAPTFSARYRNESDVPPPVVRDRLVIEDFPMGAITTAWINMVKEGLAEWIRVPVIVARGVNPG